MNPKKLSSELRERCRGAGVIIHFIYSNKARSAISLSRYSQISTRRHPPLTHTHPIPSLFLTRGCNVRWAVEGLRTLENGAWPRGTDGGWDAYSSGDMVRGHGRDERIPGPGPGPQVRPARLAHTAHPLTRLAHWLAQSLTRLPLVDHHPHSLAQQSPPNSNPLL